MDLLTSCQTLMIPYSDILIIPIVFSISYELYKTLPASLKKRSGICHFTDEKLKPGESEQLAESLLKGQAGVRI